MKAAIASLALIGALVGGVASAATPAKTGTVPPPHSANITVVADGVKSCDLPHLRLWFRYSNGYTWNDTVIVRGANEVIYTADPSNSARKLPTTVLVNYTPLVCVTDAYKA